MKFKNRCEGILNLSEVFGDLILASFIGRENRFVGKVSVNGKISSCHISDTGRLKELLVPDSKVALAKNPQGYRTDYKLVAVKKGDEWVLINTLVHSKIAQEIIRRGYLGFLPEEIKTEVVVGKSRIDFLIDRNFFIEVKGVNLVIDDVCLFPDAPTERGRKHLLELIRLKEEGYRAGIMMLSFVECSCFSPNKKTDEAFSKVFDLAVRKGIEFFGFMFSLNYETKYVCLKNKLKLCQ